MKGVDLVTVVGAITFALMVLGAVYAVVKYRSINTVIAINNELRSDVAYQAQKFATDIAELQRDRVADQLQCERQIAELNGRLSVLTDGFAEQIVSRVANSVETYLKGKNDGPVK